MVKPQRGHFESKLSVNSARPSDHTLDLLLPFALILALSPLPVNNVHPFQPPPPFFPRPRLFLVVAVHPNERNTFHRGSAAEWPVSIQLTGLETPQRPTTLAVAREFG